MSRFIQGDHVLLLRRFLGLFPSRSGVVVSCRPDEFRQIFDEYTVEFSGGRTVPAFDFQLVEDWSKYTIITPAPVVDTSVNPPPAQVRGLLTARSILFRADHLDIHLKITELESEFSLLGQLLERGTPEFPGGIEVRLLQDNTPIHVDRTNDFGEFTFSRIPAGVLGVELLHRNKSHRILAPFSTEA